MFQKLNDSTLFFLLNSCPDGGAPTEIDRQEIFCVKILYTNYS